LLKPFIRYHDNKICPDEHTNAADGQPENITPLLTVSWHGGIKIKINLPGR